MKSSLSTSLRCLITGIFGQDGTIICQKLIKLGCDVIGTTRHMDSSKINLARSRSIDVAKFIEFDIYNSSDWSELLQSYEFDVIFHFAAQSSVAKSFSEPLETLLESTNSTSLMLESVLMYSPKTKVIIANSSEIFQVTSSPVNEGTLKKPRSPYALGKLISYNISNYYREKYDLWISNAFLSNHESIYRGQAFVTIKILQAALSISKSESDSIMLGNVDVVRDWGWAPEYMDAILKMSTLDASADLLIATGKSISLRHFAEAIFDFFDLNLDDYLTIDPRLLRRSEADAFYSDPSLSFEMLKWHPLVTGLAVPGMLCKTFLDSPSVNS